MRLPSLTVRCVSLLTSFHNACRLNGNFSCTGPVPDLLCPLQPSLVGCYYRAYLNCGGYRRGCIWAFWPFLWYFWPPPYGTFGHLADSFFELAWVLLSGGLKERRASIERAFIK